MKRNGLLLGIGVGVVAAVSLGSAAFADTYRVPGYVEVGTNGSDAGSRSAWPWLAVSQGGCAKGTVAVSIGEPNRDCGAYGNWDMVPGTGDAEGGWVAVGLLGADANGGWVAVSDSGDTRITCQWYVTDLCVTSVAVSGTGPAASRDAAVSGTGRASGSSQYIHNLASVSGTGDATWTFTAVSGTGNADGNLVAVAPDGDAHSQGGVAVSVTGDADGGLAGVSVLGDTGLAP